MLLGLNVSLVALVVISVVLRVGANPETKFQYDNDYDYEFDFSEDLGPCRFAPLFTQQDLLYNKTKREEFKWRVFSWEGNFAKDGVGLNLATGMTYDGHGIDYASGLPAEGYLHYWSAPSKESLHLVLLARALMKNPFALRFVCNTCTSQEDALSHTFLLLNNKINTYNQFDRDFPGFAGFLPWYDVNDTGIEPTWDWQDRVPALDNGEWIWGLRAVIYALGTYPPSSPYIQQYPSLLSSYQAKFNQLADNVLMVFYGGGGRIRAVTQITNTSSQPYAGNYGPQVPCGRPCWLDDPYEGEMMVFFADLYGKWEDPSEREKIWRLKLLKLRSVEFEVPSQSATITVQEGWWFSAHEQWKYLELPYLDVDINRRVFMNGERARSWNSFQNGYAGLFASVNDVTQSPSLDVQYLSAAGIPSIAFQPVEKFTTVTPYGSFPLFLTGNEEIAMVWYHLMLNGPSMQGQFGSTESCNVTGSAISPVLTWDSKISTIGAMIGGISDLNRAALKEDGHYDRFIKVISEEWNIVFKSLNGEGMPFVLPSATIGQNLPDFTTCNSETPY